MDRFCSGSRALVMPGILLLLAWSRPAIAADEPPAEEKGIPVLLDVPKGSVMSIESISCASPCTAKLARGQHVLVREHYDGENLVTDFRETITVDGPSVLGVRDSSTLHVASGIIAATGAAIVLAAVLIPLVVCKSQTTIGPSGQPQTTNPCDGISDGAKVGWIAGAGVGLSLGIVGGILFFSSSGPPRATVDPWQTARAPAPSLGSFGLSWSATF